MCRLWRAGENCGNMATFGVVRVIVILYDQSDDQKWLDAQVSHQMYLWSSQEYKIKMSPG
jgi:hypothetical protein